MKLASKLLGAVGGAALIVGCGISPVGATTIEDTYPETPETNKELPVVHTYHKSDQLKANVLNPHPVCNAFQDYRTVIYKASDKFSPVGTISTTNETEKDIPLTQSLSRTQTIGLSVNGNKSHTTSVNLGGTGNLSKGSINAGIAFELAKTIGGEASYELSWTVGQDVGPYQVPSGYTGEATYGFRTVSLTGTQQHCKANGTWSTPTAWRAFVPLKNEVKVKLYDDVVDSRPRD